MTDSRDEHEPYGITPKVKDADIVPWLRCEADAAAHQPSPWRMLAAAADAIERLRAERDEVRQSYCSLMEAYRGGDGKATADKLGWGYLFDEDKPCQ